MSSLGETAGRLGGACKGLFEHQDELKLENGKRYSTSPTLVQLVLTGFPVYVQGFKAPEPDLIFPHQNDRLVGLVGRRPPRERKVPGSNPACAGMFSGSSHTSDLAPMGSPSHGGGVSRLSLPTPFSPIFVCPSAYRNLSSVLLFTHQLLPTYLQFSSSDCPFCLHRPFTYISLLYKPSFCHFSFSLWSTRDPAR